MDKHDPKQLIFKDWILVGAFYPTTWMNFMSELHPNATTFILMNEEKWPNLMKFVLVHEHETIGLIFMMFQDALTSSME